VIVSVFTVHQVDHQCVCFILFYCEEADFLSMLQSTACSLGLSATSQQYFSLRTNQPQATSQQYSSLRTNQHQPSATSQPNRLYVTRGCFQEYLDPVQNLL
jgi:hypothetical protein